MLLCHKDSCAVQDNVFVRVVASVMYRVRNVHRCMLCRKRCCLSDHARHVLSGLCWLQVQDGKQAQYDAFYRLSNTEQQITSYVFDVRRTSLQDSSLGVCRKHHAGFSLPSFCMRCPCGAFRQAWSTRGLTLLQVVRAIVPKIILDDVFTVKFPFSSLSTFRAIVV